MRIGGARVSKADDSQSLDLQRDALRADGMMCARCQGRRVIDLSDQQI